MTDIRASTFFRRQDGYVPPDGTPADRTYHQTSAAWTAGFDVGSRHGTWTAVERLFIHTSVVFNAPGCGRVAGNEVDCIWNSVPVFG